MFISSLPRGDFDELFRKDMLIVILEVAESQCFTLFPEDTFLERPQRGGIKLSEG